jgi:Homing endonuclease associated repeat
MRQADYDQAVEAARRWIAQHGHYPPAAGVGALGPTTRTIKRRWGWEQLMREAAGNGRLGPQGDTRKARRLELLCALRRAHEELGRWPTASEWEFATSSHASRRSYVRQFGSWQRACRTAARLRL